MNSPHPPSQRDAVRASLLTLGSHTERKNSYALTALKPCARCDAPRSRLFCVRCDGKAA